MTGRYAEGTSVDPEKSQAYDFNGSKTTVLQLGPGRDD